MEKGHYSLKHNNIAKILYEIFLRQLYFREWFLKNKRANKSSCLFLPGSLAKYHPFIRNFLHLNSFHCFQKRENYLFYNYSAYNLMLTSEHVVPV